MAGHGAKVSQLLLHLINILLPRLDVNYGGSSGYGRAYIERLSGKWGIVDVADAIVAARTLSAAPYNLIDSSRVCVRGGSAGGFSTLAAISLPEAKEDRTVFAAAQSSYGISDLKKLMQFTHKFESHYLFKLVGGTDEEVPEVYKERSPVLKADKIETPLLVRSLFPRPRPRYAAESHIPCRSCKARSTRLYLRNSRKIFTRRSKNVVVWWSTSFILGRDMAGDRKRICEMLWRGSWHSSQGC